MKHRPHEISILKALDEESFTWSVFGLPLHTPCCWMWLEARSLTSSQTTAFSKRMRKIVRVCDGRGTCTNSGLCTAI